MRANRTRFSKILQEYDYQKRVKFNRRFEKEESLREFIMAQADLVQIVDEFGNYGPTIEAGKLEILDKIDAIEEQGRTALENEDYESMALLKQAHELLMKKLNDYDREK